MTTVEPSQGNNLPATQGNFDRPEGLEDFGTEDQVMPMIRIDHTHAQFVDSLSEQRYDELTVVMLGLIKQRVLWPPDVKAEGDAEPPLCRSYNFNEGHPSSPQKFANGTEMERFPWEASGFEQGSSLLPCSQCNLKDWGSHPKRDSPWCSEQHNFAMLIPQENGTFVPCLFQIQRSGLKPSRQYLSSFANSNQPLFTVYTKITLEAKKMGSNPFAVPKFERQHATEQANFPEFSSMYRGVRDFLQTPRTDDEEETTDDLSAETPVAAPVSQPQAQQPAPAPAAPQQPAQQAAPAPQAAPVTPIPAQPQETPQQPAEVNQEPVQAPQPVQTAPVQQPASVSPGIAGASPGIAPQPVQAPTQEPQQAPVQAPTAEDDDDEIPF